MPTRCSDTHFYVAGHKTRSGCAVYTSPDGTELAVVCGRNRPGPGQIHLRAVPDGVTLAVTGPSGSVDLVLDKAATRGRKGRARFDLAGTSVSFAGRETYLQNCIAEIPKGTGEGRSWGTMVVNTALEELVRGDPLEWVRTHDLARHVHASWWQAWARTGDLGKDRCRHWPLVRQAVHQLEVLDPTIDRRAYRTALRTAATMVAATGAPVDALWRLQAHLGRHGPELSREAVAQLLAHRPEAVTALARQWCAERGTPNAARTRALGLETYRQLLETTYKRTYPKGLSHATWWTAASALADPNAAPLHHTMAAFLNDKAPGTARGNFSHHSQEQDEWFGIVYRLACPAAREALDEAAPALVALRRADAVWARHRPDAPHPAGILYEEATRWWGVELDTVGALIADSGPDPVARARGFFGDDLRLPRGNPAPRPEYRDDSFDPMMTIQDCLESGLDDAARIERLVSAHARVLPYPSDRRDVGTLLALADHGVHTRDDHALLELAGAATPAAIAAVLDAGRTPYAVAFATRCPVGPDVRRALIDAGGNEIDYAYFKGASIDDPAEMVARLQAGVSGRCCLELTALGVTERDAQRDAVAVVRRELAIGGASRGWYIQAPHSPRRREEDPIVESDFAGYVAAGFGTSQLDEALALQLPAPKVAKALRADVPADEILPAWRDGVLDAMVSYREYGVVTTAADTRLLVAHGIGAELAREYVTAGVKDPRAMAVFKQSGLVTHDQIAAHVAQAPRPSTARALW